MVFYKSRGVIALIVLILFLFVFTFFKFTGFSIFGEGSAGSVNLFWSDNSNNEDGFGVERADSTPASFFEIANVSIDITTYADSAVTGGETYFYRVRAFNTQGFSAYSNVVNVTVPTNGSNVSTTVPPSGGGGGGGSSSNSGNRSITGNYILNNGSVESGQRSSDNSGANSSGSESSSSQPFGSNLISGQAIKEDLNSRNISKLGLVALIFGVAFFILFKIIHYSLAKIFHGSEK